MTPPPFSPTSRARFVNKAEIIASLRRLARDLKKKKRPAGVFLFGSFATDSYTPRSDGDILIVIDKDDRYPRDRIPEYISYFLDAPLPVDVFPFTLEEIQRNMFLKKALEQGIDLLA